MRIEVLDVLAKGAAFLASSLYELFTGGVPTNPPRSKRRRRRRNRKSGSRKRRKFETKNDCNQHDEDEIGEVADDVVVSDVGVAGGEDDDGEELRRREPKPTRVDIPRSSWTTDSFWKSLERDESPCFVKVPDDESLPLIVLQRSAGHSQTYLADELLSFQPAKEKN